jgi:hypothetical protein
LFNELIARTFATDGQILVSYTPIGDGAASGVTYRFLSEGSPDRGVHRITSEEVKHISIGRRAENAESVPDHEREARLEGIPQLGSGPIFPLELITSCTETFDPTQIPQWARWCVGIDMGYAHPFAAVLIAWVPDLADVYVINSFRVERSSALVHAQRIHSMCGGLRLPVAYPHDALTHDKGSGVELASQYKGFGLNMMKSHAVNHGKGTNAVEPALAEIRELMFLGKLHIEACNRELLEEMRHYHRNEDFKIVKQRDDLVSAFRYALMMKRNGIGYGPMPFAGQRRRGSGEVEIAKDMDVDVF